MVDANRARLVWLAGFLKICPHAIITYNTETDHDRDIPAGYYSIVVESCSSMMVSARTLEECIDLAMVAKPDEDNNVIVKGE